MLVSSIDALMPGSKLRSEIDIRLGESAGRLGDEGALSGDKLGCFSLLRSNSVSVISPKSGLASLLVMIDSDLL